MGQCCSAPRSATAPPALPAAGDGQPTTGEIRGLTIAAAVHSQPLIVSPHSGSATSSVSPGSEKRRRAVAASPTRFFELLAEPSANKRKELLLKATTEYQSHSDLGPFAPDSPQSSIASALRVESPQNSVKKSRLSALFSRAPPNEDASILQDMCGEAWIPRSSLHHWRALGSGAFAVVQQCVLKLDNGPGVPVAVKKLKAHVLNNTADLREFLSEANTLRRLEHRHIVEFKGVGCMEPHTPETMASTLFIVQEFMSGSTLKVHVLHQMFPSNSSTIEAAYSWKDALRWLQQIASALKYLHGLHPMVVHRDLKLENLLLTGSNPATADAKLADFGLCKLVKDTAVAVPFVPSTPNSNPQSQKAISSTDPAAQPAPSSRPTDGQAVGSTPLPAPSHPPDDSAHASRQTADEAGGSTASVSAVGPVTIAQSGISKVDDAADAANNRQASSQTASCSGNHTVSSMQSAACEQGGSDAEVQQNSERGPPTNTSGPISQPSTSDVHTAAAMTAELHTADAVSGQRAIDSALSISAKEVELTAQAGSPTALEWSHSAQGYTPAPIAVSNTGTSDAVGSAAAASESGLQLPSRPAMSVQAGAAEPADSQTNAAVMAALTAVPDVSKVTEAQGQEPEHGQGLIPAFLGTAAQAGQGQSKAAVAVSGDDGEVLYNMTGQTGSLMYMAPEVMKGQSYNEKVDVFSFAVIIFELLSFRVAMAAIGDDRDLDYEAVHAHAQEVSHGLRLPLPTSWPPAVQALIRDCWAQKSSQRPSFAAIEQRLQDIQASGVIEEYVAAHARKHANNNATGAGCILQ